MAQEAVDLSVSVVCYQEDNKTLSRTLAALATAVARAQEDFAEPFHCTLTLIDNGPNDASAADFEALLDQPCRAALAAVKIIRRPDNPGFGRGNNLAILVARSQMHLVLNPDAELAADALSRGVRFLQHNEDAVAVAPNVRGPDGQAEFLAKDYPSVLVLALRGFAPLFLRDRFRPMLDAYELRDRCGDNCGSVAVRLASGCCLLARSSALREIGGFDEKYFLYFEDFDLCLRLGSLGRIYYLSDMHLVHYGGGAARKGWRHRLSFLRSALRFFDTHGWRWI